MGHDASVYGRTHVDSDIYPYSDPTQSISSDYDHTLYMFASNPDIWMP